LRRAHQAALRSGQHLDLSAKKIGAIKKAHDLWTKAIRGRAFRQGGLLFYKARGAHRKPLAEVIL
jgi:hypothetical protein